MFLYIFIHFSSKLSSILNCHFVKSAVPKVLPVVVIAPDILFVNLLSTGFVSVYQYSTAYLVIGVKFYKSTVSVSVYQKATEYLVIGVKSSYLLQVQFHSHDVDLYQSVQRLYPEANPLQISVQIHF
jgi:hypothetical protein